MIDPLAKKIGAANTIIINDSKLSAYNTDCVAAVESITAGLGIDKAGLRKMPVAVIGRRSSEGDCGRTRRS